MADAEPLSRREHCLVTLAALAADAPGRLDDHVFAALENRDLTLEELFEVVLHFAVYAGWPKASHFEMVVGMQWARLHEERGEEPPPWPVLAPDDRQTGADRRAAGLRMFEEVNRFPAPPSDTPYRQAVVEWVFGDLWWRPGISRRDRRFVSITCAALSGAPFALATHVSTALHSGDLTKEEMDAVVRLFGVHCGTDRARPLADAVEQAWSTRPGA